MSINIDDHKALKYFLDTQLFNKKVFDQNELIPNIGIELIIRPECNQRCDYCYITQYGKSLYPIELRPNNETLVHNTEILLNYLYNNQCYLHRLELFAGDLFYDNLFFQLIEKIYDYYKKILSQDINYFSQKRIRPAVIIPCNFSFCKDIEKINHFKSYFYKFKELGITLYLSYSSDGIFSTQYREKEPLNDEFLNNVFTLIQECNYGAHPMLSYENIEYAIQNYEWWKQQYQKYNLINEENRFSFFPPSLEVRNHGWDQEHIQTYINYLNYLIEDRLKIYNNNLELFTADIFNKNINYADGNLHGPMAMDPIKINFNHPESNEMSCSLGHVLCIYVGDLTLVPCHRLSYPMYKGGQFVLNQEKTEIVDIQALDNVNGYFNQIMSNRFYNPKCCICDYQALCLKGCHGAQFEHFRDPNMPIPDICDLFKMKADFLLAKYSQLGVLQLAVKNKYLSNFEIENINKILIQLGENPI